MSGARAPRGAPALPEGPGWQPTAAHARAVGGALVLGAVAVLARRPDLVLAAPLGAAAVWGAVRRPAAVPRMQQRLAHGVVREGEVTTWHVEVDAGGGGRDAEAVAVELYRPAWVDSGPEGGVALAHLAPGGRAAVALPLRPLRWGRRHVGPATVVVSSAWGAFRWAAPRSSAAALALTALPRPDTFDATGTPVRTPGLVGLHRSPRPGSGTEFAGIRPFQPGDRLRRVHWPRSLRSGTLHVATTWADHDRHVLLLVDAFHDVGFSEGVDGRPSSLDVAVRAAAALAEHHVSVGDRVGLLALGAGVRRVPPASGRRHLRRLLGALAGIEAVSGLLDDGRTPPSLGQDPLVLMFSALVSPRALQRATTLAHHGLAVVVVDCLPADIASREPGDPYAAIAWRIRLLERQREVRRVGEAGVAVVPWRGARSLDLVLRELQRRPGAIGRRR